MMMIRDRFGTTAGMVLRKDSAALGVGPLVEIVFEEAEVDAYCIVFLISVRYGDEDGGWQGLSA